MTHHLLRPLALLLLAALLPAGWFSPSKPALATGMLEQARQSPRLPS